jgi:hypothetical protein
VQPLLWRFDRLSGTVRSVLSWHERPVHPTPHTVVTARKWLLRSSEAVGDVLVLNPVCQLHLDRPNATHSRQITFSKPVSQPNSGFANWNANKRPLATSRNRPKPVIQHEEILCHRASGSGRITAVQE